MAMSTPMTSRTAVRTDPATPAVPERSLAADSPRPHHVFILAAWCGMIAGPLEVGAIVVRKHTVDLNQFYWMSRHFVWLIPLTNLLIFLLLGLLLAMLTLAWPRRGRRLSARLLCGLTVLPPFWAAFPRIYGLAGLLLVLGIAAWVVPILARRAAGFRRFVAISLPVVASLTPLLAATVWMGDRFKQRDEEARPLPPADSPNVLLIVLDTVAADHLSLHGYSRPTSPTLDELARRGIRFDRVQATSSWTLPSHASFFTGRWPHQLSAGWLTPLDATYPTLAEYLGSRGYATAGFIANLFYCGDDTGLGRGFTHYQDYIFPGLSAFKPAGLVDRPLEGLRAIYRFIRDRTALALVPGLFETFDAGNRKPAAVVSREFLDWISRRRQPNRPFFGFLNYYDVHYPYQLPEGSVHRFGMKPGSNHEVDLLENWRTLDKTKLTARDVAFARDSYDDCIADLDEQLGRMLDELGRRGILGRTWLIITSDHGESFGEPAGDFGHGTSLYQPQVHVPLLIVPPESETTVGNPSPTVVPESVCLRDLPATIVDLVHLRAGSPFPGGSLARLWHHPDSGDSADLAPSGPSPAFSEAVPTNILDPEPEKLLEERPVWGSLADGDWVYIQVRYRDQVKYQFFDLRTDPRQELNLAGDPANQPRLDRLRTILDRLMAEPPTIREFRP
jgi:arylsulfatase A-like enzyme